MNLESIISENVTVLIHIFSTHPNNRIALVKDLIKVDKKTCEDLYLIYLDTGFKTYNPKKETKQTKIEIEQLRGLGISVSKKDLSIAIPYETKLNGLALKSLDKLKRFGYTIIRATC